MQVHCSHGYKYYYQCRSSLFGDGKVLQHTGSSGSSSSSVDCEADTEDASESTEDASEVVATYSCRRRTNSWPLALFHNLVDISHYNAYVLWTSIEPSWQQQKPYRRRLFIEEVGEMLVTPHIKKRGRLPRSSPAHQPLQQCPCST
ncbi:hypothetical protein KUCAC02_000245 [Chaenocephalus aceratus]|uniref:Uncharacterized protein n=1 Tax=Chaenocephalus aceratus TaxID=36190 RepID=A0ACB9W534_CHAAC|nr:hypothetical protein KUCAC02_000245 [Chaenocephalus aceratus]